MVDPDAAGQIHDAKSPGVQQGCERPTNAENTFITPTFRLNPRTPHGRHPAPTLV